MSEEPPVGHPTEEATALRRRVLIVEDEGLTILYLQKVLRTAGYEIVGKASDGLQAIELSRQLLPDFILMDVNMPRMGGIEATRQIMEEYPIPIIMLTAYSELQVLEEAKEAGACGYLVKPLVTDQMLPAITEAFRCYDEFLKTGIASFVQETRGGAM